MASKLLVGFYSYVLKAHTRSQHINWGSWLHCGGYKLSLMTVSFVFHHNTGAPNRPHYIWRVVSKRLTHFDFQKRLKVFYLVPGAWIALLNYYCPRAARTRNVRRSIFIHFLFSDAVTSVYRSNLSILTWTCSMYMYNNARKVLQRVGPNTYDFSVQLRKVYQE